MLVRGGRGGGDAQFAEMDGELVGDGVGVLDHDIEDVGVLDDDIEGVTDDVTDGELVNDGVGVAVGVLNILELEDSVGYAL